MSSNSSEHEPRPKPGPEAPANIWTKLHLDDVSKILALVGTLLYGVLFMAYRAYYDALNLSPEDVGVDPIYVLVRSPGFIVMTLISAGLLFLFYTGTTQLMMTFVMAGRLFPAMRMGKLALVRATMFTVLIIVASVLLWFYLAPIGGGALSSAPTVPFVSTALLVLAAMSYSHLRWVSWPRSLPIRYVEICATVLLVAAVPSVLIVGIAEILGGKAARGESVRSVQVLGVVILDVSAPPVGILWADPKTPHPPYFGSVSAPVPATGTLLGQTGTSVVANLKYNGGQRVVRFDARQIIVEYR